jgi:tRNA A-37 threonylcarbamoyl transferase component Bud32
MERLAMTNQLNKHTKEQILQLCEKVAGSRQIAAVCVYGPWVCGYADKKTDVNVLLVLDRFPLRLNTYSEAIDDVKVLILAVNRIDFERDIRRGWLGEVFAEKITLPYEPLKNSEYLWTNEVKIKKRIVLELLENLILEFTESSHEFIIKKEYFMYEVLMRRAKVFPPLTYSFLNMFSNQEFETKNVITIMKGYLRALEELEQENIIVSYEGHIKITQNHIEAVKKLKIRLPSFLKTLQRLALSPMLSVLSESTGSLIQDQRLFNKNNQKTTIESLVSRLEDPKKHVLLPTSLGYVSLSDKSDIEAVARRIIPDGKFSTIEVKNIGNILNDVYSLTLTKEGNEQKFVVKRYIDLSNLKWLPLTLWAFGTTTFSVLGRSRLEKEYTINNFLQSKGFSVPKIFYISHQKRLIFEEFIEGENLVKVVKRMFSPNKTKTDIELIKEAGRKVAKAHSLGVSLGDCKPENFIVTKDDIVFLDLEQATRNGNQTWDIAEFLYYSGHYSPAIANPEAATTIAKIFIEGYLEAGGKKDKVQEAASPRYTKVFSVFTVPQVLLAISRVCQKMGKTN